MCGFVGIVDKDVKNDYSKQISKMLKYINHRGPDETMIYSNQKAGIYLGFARLSMIDLENSSQPYMDDEGNTIVLFNGEIYNYESLKKELINAGESFKTNGEVEVIHRLYMKYDMQFLTKLDGMFAICIIDILRKRCIFARDSFGIKPLYYSQNENTIVFASELTPIHMFYNTSISRTAVELFFTCRFIPAPFTIYNDIFKLCAGEYIIVDEEGKHVSSFYPFNQVYITNEFDNCHMHQLLEKSIKECYFSSDVPIGVFLSGGIDSGIIASVLRNQLKIGNRTYTVDYNYDVSVEVKNVDTIVKELEIGHRKVHMGDNILETFNQVIASLDEPIYSTVAMSTYCLANIASKQVKGILTGDGSDELVFGYKYLRDSLTSNNIYYSYLNGIGWLKHIQQEDFLGNTLLKKDDILQLLLKDCEIDSNPVETLRRVELFKRLPDYHLMRVDRLTMASGVEARVPYLRKEYVEYLLSINGDFFLKQNDVKYALKLAFSHSIPSVLLNSEKRPFTSPIKKWIENELKVDIARLFNASHIADRLQISHTRIIRLLDEYKGRYEDVANVWGIFVLLKWCEINGL